MSAVHAAAETKNTANGQAGGKGIVIALMRAKSQNLRTDK